MKQYGKLSTEFYDLDKPCPPPDAFRFYLDYSQKAGGPVLEPMCGSGRFLIPLMTSGIEVIGVDSSLEMLTACQRKAKLAGLQPALYQQYLHQLKLPGVYPLIIIPAGSFCLLTEPIIIRECLERLYAYLSTGGLFIVEIDQPNFVGGQSSPANNRWVERPDGTKIVMFSTCQVNSEEKTSHHINRYALIQGSKTVETEWEELALRYYTPDEITRLLENTGFTNIHYHSAFDQNHSQENSESLVFISSKS